jgi:hypothetical protein
MMDGEGSQGIKKVHFRDSSQVPLITYKRRRRQKPQQLEPQQQVEPQPQTEPEQKGGDVPVQQV